MCLFPIHASYISLMCIFALFQQCYGNLCHEENANVKVQGGSYLVEGDILCEDDKINKDHKVIEKGTHKWGPEMKYQIDGRFDDRAKTIIRDTLMNLETKVKKDALGCKFSLKEERPENQSQSIFFVKGDGYYTAVGKTASSSSPHNISLAAIEKGKSGSIVHELMHAMGFWHEHVRPDRDKYITVNKRNIKKMKEIYFIRLNSNEVQGDFTDIKYDPCSLLHYGEYAFSNAKGKKTITSKQILPDGCEMGQRREATRSDIERIRKMFKCETKTGTGEKSGP
ncbi:zinc metalloproteinase nas-4-like [Pecten maximus]|uniref:zinc metalloproteinase nas-4-like n=1 Tax=Pecten maximus TaxID=6579 RepID=UPI0014582ED2|nr:zinc metalloproteinase nas-4-like [Pecten maximus]